ncbi:hypothetical protein Tco_1227001 [Tanacetum coccineum]|uniref:Uncharacterized protein n=1 Tax=Tanacetum coccineum TaxID=301880 RepID=A0ABQ4WGV3_9ASTR
MLLRCSVISRSQYPLFFPPTKLSRLRKILPEMSLFSISHEKPLLLLFCHPLTTSIAMALIVLEQMKVFNPGQRSGLGQSYNPLKVIVGLHPNFDIQGSDWNLLHDPENSLCILDVEFLSPKPPVSDAKDRTAVIYRVHISTHNDGTNSSKRPKSRSLRFPGIRLKPLVGSTPLECERFSVSSISVDIPSNHALYYHLKIVQNVLIRDQSVHLKSQHQHLYVSGSANQLRFELDVCLVADASDSLAFFELWSSCFGGGWLTQKMAESESSSLCDLPRFIQLYQAALRYFITAVGNLGSNMKPKHQQSNHQPSLTSYISCSNLAILADGDEWSDFKGEMW